VITVADVDPSANYAHRRRPRGRDWHPSGALPWRAAAALAAAGHPRTQEASMKRAQPQTIAAAARDRPAHHAQIERRLVLGQSARSATRGPAGIQMNAARSCTSTRQRGGRNQRQRIELRTLDDQYEPDKCRANTETSSRRRVRAVRLRRSPRHWRRCRWPPEQGAVFARSPARGAARPFSRYVFHVRASYYDETAAIVKQ